MSNYHLNRVASKSQPRQAAVGQLGDGVAIDDVVSGLVNIGVDEDRMYFLVGAEGAKTLRGTRGFFSVFDEVIDKPLGALDAGATIVGVFGVGKDDAEQVRVALRESGVVNTHYFGKWTFS